MSICKYWADSALMCIAQPIDTHARVTNFLEIIKYIKGVAIKNIQKKDFYLMIFFNKQKSLVWVPSIHH